MGVDRERYVRAGCSREVVVLGDRSIASLESALRMLLSHFRSGRSTTSLKVSKGVEGLGRWTYGVCLAHLALEGSRNDPYLDIHLLL